MRFENRGLFRVDLTRAPEAEPAPVPPVDPYADWSRIASALRRGDPGSYNEFMALYANGARILFRRRVGSVRAERMVPEALAGAASEIRLGWIQTPRDLVFFLRDLCEDHSAQKNQAALDSPAELARIRLPAARLEALLARLTAAEREAVRIYYTGKATLAEAIAETGLDPSDAARLLRRLRLTFSQPEADTADENAWHRPVVRPASPSRPDGYRQQLRVTAGPAGTSPGG